MRVQVALCLSGQGVAAVPYGRGGIHTVQPLVPASCLLPLGPQHHHHPTCVPFACVCDAQEKDNRKLKLKDQDFLGAGGWDVWHVARSCPFTISLAGCICACQVASTGLLPSPRGCLPPAAQGRFLLSDLLTAAGQTLTLSLTDGAGRVLPGCSAVLSAEELPNTNAVVRG